MRVEIRDQHGRVIGEIRLVNGELRYEPGWEWVATAFIAPNAPGPDEPEKFLRALPHLLRSPYAWASVVED
jgi:hypothetical protein